MRQLITMAVGLVLCIMGTTILANLMTVHFYDNIPEIWAKEPTRSIAASIMVGVGAVMVFVDELVRNIKQMLEANK